jgi:hypothetical protein
MLAQRWKSLGLQAFQYFSKSRGKRSAVVTKDEDLKTGCEQIGRSARISSGVARKLMAAVNVEGSMILLYIPFRPGQFKCLLNNRPRLRSLLN